MNKHRWYHYFLILVMVFSIVSSVYVHRPNVCAVTSTFGNTSVGTGTVSIEDFIAGGEYTMGATGGTADNISIYIKTYTGGVKVKCAIYDSSKNLINSTEERADCTINDWNVFAFADPKPSLTANTDYILVAWADGATSYAAQSGAPANSRWYIGDPYNSWPDPIGEPTSSSFRSIYCSYTEDANTAPSQSGEVPGNSSTDISVTPDLYVNCSDTDGDNLNASWWSNSSGSWLQFASNWTSFASGTNITQNFPNATAYGQIYYWSVNLSDGTDWTNETYYFTTKFSGTMNVTTNTTTGIGQQNATLHGYLVNDSGETCRVGFEWGTTTGYGHTDFDLPFISGWNPPSDYSNTELFQFPKDIWLYNSSIESNNTCENFLQQGGVYDTVDKIFRYNSTSDDLESWWKNDPENEVTHIDNSTDHPEFYYIFHSNGADTLSFTYDNLTAETNDEFGHQIGIIGGLHLYGLSPGTTYHYRAFATNTTATVYGSDMNFTTSHNWTTTLNCFNASDGSPITGWDVFITNQSGSHTYTRLNNNNPLCVNLSNGTCPTGTNIAFMFSKENYTNRTYYYDISITGNYTIDAYLNFYNGSNLYLLSVLDEIDQPVSDAKVAIKEYINETLGYLNVTIVYTDGNGQVAVYLIPEILYKVIITKDGYQTEEADYEPSSLIFTHTFRLESEEITPPPPYVESEEITFNGYISGTTLYINFTDNLEQTIDAQIHIYEVDSGTGITSLFHSNSTTGDSDYQINTAINRSNAYWAYLFYNHTTFGYKTRSEFFDIADKTTVTTQAAGDLLFDLNYGYCPFGWSNLFMFLFLLACFFSFGQRGSGISLIFTGGLVLLLNYIIGFNTTLATIAGAGIPVLFIILGVMVLWRDSKKEASS